MEKRIPKLGKAMEKHHLQVTTASTTLGQIKFAPDSWRSLIERYHHAMPLPQGSSWLLPLILGFILARL